MAKLFGKKKDDKERRALTVYFPTAKMKQGFDKTAEGMGLSASKLGMLLVLAGIKDGFKVKDGNSVMQFHFYDVVDSKKRPRPRQHS